MITEEGVVEKISHSKAVVRVQRSSACARCGSRSACQVTEGRAMLIEVTNDLQARVHDHVEISVPGGSLLKLSLLVYFLPVLALIAGAGAGAAWAQSFNAQPTLASIVCGGLAMGIAFCVLKWVDRRTQAKRDFQPRITRILFSAKGPPPVDSR